MMHAMIGQRRGPGWFASARVCAASRLLALSLVCPMLWATAAAADNTRFLAEPCTSDGCPGCRSLDCDAGCKSRCEAWADNEWRLLCRDNCYRPKTLFAWQGTERTFVNGTEDEPLESDRPDFTEAATTVGLRRVQVEMGYTYIQDNGATDHMAHSFPETLLRVGMFAEWFEVRIGWNYGVNLDSDDIVSNIFAGGEDIYLGAKVALTEQDGWLPEIVILPQMNVPAGHEDLTSGEVEPGVNWLYAWEVNDFVAIGASTQVNRRLDDSDVFFAEWAQSVAVNYTLADQVAAFTEWFAFFPAGSVDALPEHYFNGGFTYRPNNNSQLDIRAGVGLNDPADDFFAGTGAVLRF